MLCGVFLCYAAVNCVVTCGKHKRTVKCHVCWRPKHDVKWSRWSGILESTGTTLTCDSRIWPELLLLDGELLVLS